MDEKNFKPFHFEQNNSELFVLYLKTMLLSVCTLGIYTFWARVAITKYLYARTSFGNQNFDYHATGKEMFLGFIKGAAIVGLAGIALGLLSLLPFKAFVFGAVYLGLILFVAPLIMVGKWRFWLSRSSFCNVRFGHKGEYKATREIWIKGLLLTIVTFGIYSPILGNKLQKYFFNNTRFGNLAFAYTGEDMEYFWISMKGLLLSVLTLGIYSFWYSANVNRYIFSHTTFNDRSMNSTMTGGGLLKVSLINMLIAVFTFGLGFPIVVNRMYGYFFANLQLDAEPQDIIALAGEMDTGASALASGLEEAANLAENLSGIL